MHVSCEHTVVLFCANLSTLCCILFQKLFIFHSMHAFCQSNLARRFLGVSASLHCLSASLRLLKHSSHCFGVSTFLCHLVCFSGVSVLKCLSLANESAMFQLSNRPIANFFFCVIQIVCTVYGMRLYRHIYMYIYI